MTGKSSQSEGFTLVEALIVVAIAIVLSSIAIISMQSVTNASDDANAYTLVMGQLQYARQLSINQKTAVEVLLQAPSGSANTVTVMQQASVCGGSNPAIETGSSTCVGGTGSYASSSTSGLYYANLGLPTAPSLSEFAAGSGFPNPGPDSISGGSGWDAFSFSALSSNTCVLLRFEPDGTVQQIANSSCVSTNVSAPLATGVIYMQRIGANGVIPGSAKAITVMGATGRLMGYRYVSAGSSGSGSWTPF